MDLLWSFARGELECPIMRAQNDPVHCHLTPRPLERQSCALAQLSLREWIEVQDRLALFTEPLMVRFVVLATLALLIPPHGVGGDELPNADPSDVGLSAQRLAKIQPALQKLVSDGKIPGGVAVVARRGKVAYVTTFGYRELANKTPMTEDTIFAIASMTKPITCTAVMTLVEQGQLGLDDPVSKFIPEMKDLRALGSAKDDTATEVATVPARRPVTIRDLLSHTSGFTYEGILPVLSFNARLARTYERAGVTRRDFKTIREQVVRLANVPLAHQPGDGWTYGLSHDVLACVIEVVSGKSFDKYLRERVLKPLDMRDTSFFVPEQQRDRVATIYVKDNGGALTAMPKNFGSETFFAGGHGLFSTARDYTRFAQMIANGGELNGARILMPETIGMMTTNQIAEKEARIGAFSLGKYGLGFGLILAPEKPGGEPVLNRYYWGGYFSTNFWIDPRHDLVAVIMTQVLPTNNGGASELFRRVLESAVQ
jgi:CubicO group peptidase (beta-lactamase class C family)